MFILKQILLSQGLFALVDDEDYEYLNQFKWYAVTHKHSNTSYAGRRIGKSAVKMHTVIMNSKGIDHRDGNGLNNQKENLRKATHSQNMINRTHQVSKCKYKGVVKIKNRFIASICKDKINYYLGSFGTPEEAARVRDMKAKELHGEFAILNDV